MDPGFLDLVELQPVFNDGSNNAGNSCQVSDGAGSVLLMKRSIAMQKGLPILGVFRTFTIIGVDPAIMGVDPAAKILAIVKVVGLELGDIGLFEINEAFASQFVACPNKLELDLEKFNVNGHATSAHCGATQLHEMKRHGKGCRFGVITMCVGSTMGVVFVLERGMLLMTSATLGSSKQVFYLRMQAL